jgi:UDP:flavonoid glycosyltransferase YjiC (YdhE family)
VIVQRAWQTYSTVSGDDVLVVDEVNYARLFPRCAAAFIHGGTGTVANALRAGVPIALLPLVADQIGWARILADLGSSIGTLEPTSDTNAFSAAMQRALDPALASARVDLARRVDVNGLVVACDSLER